MVESTNDTVILNVDTNTDFKRKSNFWGVFSTTCGRGFVYSQTVLVCIGITQHTVHCEDPKDSIFIINYVVHGLIILINRVSF